LKTITNKNYSNLKLYWENIFIGKTLFPSTTTTITVKMGKKNKKKYS
jgi:hypothetical protein